MVFLVGCFFADRRGNVFFLLLLLLVAEDKLKVYLLAQELDSFF